MLAQPPATFLHKETRAALFMSDTRIRPAGLKPTVTRIALLFWALLFMSLVAQISAK